MSFFYEILNDGTAYRRKELRVKRLILTIAAALFVLITLLSLPCVLGYNVWSNLHLIGGRDVLDSEDFIVSNLLLPIGSLIYLLFCVTKWGWGFEKYCEEANTGDGIKISKKLRPYFQFILPILIVFILIQGLI